MPAPILLPRTRPPEPNTPLPQPWLPHPMTPGPDSTWLPVMSVNGKRPNAGGDVEVTIPEVVHPSAEGEGKAADAKATFEALEDKATKSELIAEVDRAKEVEKGLDERITELENDEGGGGGVAELMIETTHADLVALRNNGGLIPGMQYRITDYVATTVQEHTQSANHPFDIIVTADSVDKLNEVARAIRHEGDDYFPETTKFEAWQIWYSIDNDTNRFEWADSDYGKGVIYRLIDEFDNDIPYDFKGIKMQAFLGMDTETGEESWSEDYRYTFGISEDDSTQVGVIDDNIHGSYSNKIKSYYKDIYDDDWNLLSVKLSINLITFGSDCYNNTFGSGCSSNTFGSYCCANTFGSGCGYNTFGSDCCANTFGSGCGYNTFGSDCYNNTFGSGCSSNTFGSDCYNNTFGSGCSSNTFGSDCNGNTFGSGCGYNTFGSGCYDNILYDFFSAITMQNSVEGNTINCTKDRGEYEYCRNIEIKSGVEYKEINIDDVEQSYHTEIRPENSITITV